jgi:hypothetical protein
MSLQVKMMVAAAVVAVAGIAGPAALAKSHDVILDVPKTVQVEGEFVTVSITVTNNSSEIVNCGLTVQRVYFTNPPDEFFLPIAPLYPAQTAGGVLSNPALDLKRLIFILTCDGQIVAKGKVMIRT